jgi:ADP-ribose pyrophosphatase
MTTKSSTRKDLLVHPDIEIIEATKGFERFLRVDVFRIRHRLFSGEWSAVRSYDVLRRGQAAGSCFTTPTGRASC